MLNLMKKKKIKNKQNKKAIFKLRKITFDEYQFLLRLSYVQEFKKEIEYNIKNN